MTKKTSLSRFRFSLLVVFCVLIAGGISAYQILHSPVFKISAVEIENHPEDAPVSAQTVNELAAVPIGKARLFDLKLDEIEKRILTNRWIKGVSIQKKPPTTVSISVKFRKPKGILQKDSGSMIYVDDEGITFAPVNLSFKHDLPVFVGFSQSKSQLLKEAVEFSERWKRNSLGKFSEVSALQYDADRGVRASVVVTLGGRSPTRVTLEFAKFSEVQSEASWRVIDARLQKVFRHLSAHSYEPHQIFVGDGKKIVVKTARGS